MVTFFILLWLFTFVRSLQAKWVSQWNFDQSYYFDNDGHSLIKGSRSLLQLDVGEGEDCNGDDKQCADPLVCAKKVKEKCNWKIATEGECRKKCISDKKKQCFNVAKKDCIKVCCDGFKCGGTKGKEVDVEETGQCKNECRDMLGDKCNDSNTTSLWNCCGKDVDGTAHKCGTKNGKPYKKENGGAHGKCQKKCRDMLGNKCNDSNTTSLFNCCGKEVDGTAHKCGRDGKPYKKEKGGSGGKCVVECVKTVGYVCTNHTDTPLLHCCDGYGLKCEKDGKAVTGEKRGTCQKPPTPSPSTDPTDSPNTDPTDSPSTDPTDSPSTDPTDSPSTDPTGSPSTDPTGSPTTDPPANSANIPAQHIAFKVDEQINPRDKKHFSYFGGALFVVISLLVTLILFSIKACCVQYQIIKDRDDSDDEINEQDGEKLL